MSYSTLMEAQMGEWSDSVVLTDIEMLTAMQNTTPDWVKRHKYENWKYYPARYEMNEWFTPIWYEQWKRMETEIARGQWARSAFLNRSQSPDGFFYACGKREDGTYAHVGFRYGLEGSEYASGFIDMSYTPQR